MEGGSSQNLSLTSSVGQDSLGFPVHSQSLTLNSSHFPHSICPRGQMAHSPTNFIIKNLYFLGMQPLNPQPWLCLTCLWKLCPRCPQNRSWQSQALEDTPSSIGTTLGLTWKGSLPLLCGWQINSAIFVYTICKITNDAHLKQQEGVLQKEILNSFQAVSYCL